LENARFFLQSNDFVLICPGKCGFFGLFQKSSVCFDSGPKHQNKAKKFFWGFAKQTEKQPKRIEFRCVLVPTEKQICCRGIT
jgi:hypothetical protein